MTIFWMFLLMVLVTRAKADCVGEDGTLYEEWETMPSSDPCMMCLCMSGERRCPMARICDTPRCVDGVNDPNECCIQCVNGKRPSTDRCSKEAVHA